MKAFKFSFALLVLLSLFPVMQNSFAHDGAWGADEDPLVYDWIGNGSTMDLEHVDADPWKGWASFTLKNWCGQAWGDFHFKIKGFNIANVDFIADATHQPQLWIKQGWSYVQYTGLTWTINNTVVGAEMDLFFYGNPIEHGDKALIKIYTDNTASHCSSFTIASYATPVPEPATLSLLGLGAVLLLRRRSN
jgi:hypothetical protein